METLNLQQEEAVHDEESVFVTACPGSGKTRVLTAKVVHAISEIESSKHRVVAVTFTNRAADEITSRLQEAGLPRKQAWTGTIHSFALEWILRPYACYLPELKRGFTVADEFFTRRIIDSLREQYGFARYANIRTDFDRNGEPLAAVGPELNLGEHYRRELFEQGFIDFDLVLHFALQLLQKKPEIPKTIAAMIKLICVDEYQDTQELQYGILSEIVRASVYTTRVFIVGDEDQAIYTSLGSVAKTLTEIKNEFGLSTLNHHKLVGNYRSTQRIVDFSSHFQDAEPEVQAKAAYAEEPGTITFCNQGIEKEDLAEEVARLISHHLAAGLEPQEICVLAPQWRHVTSMGRQLIAFLPGVELDAAGLSPFRSQKDSTWFKLARIILTEPHPDRYRTRLRWAGDFVKSIESDLGRELDEVQRKPRDFLRLCNSIGSEQCEGIPFLKDVFGKVFRALSVDLTADPTVETSIEVFFEAAITRIEQSDFDSDISVENLKRMFRHPSGVVVNTCHGVKGEEFTTVICFGTLKGYIPNWGRIMDRFADDREDARRLLYVVSSRARKNLHFIAEHGRQTQSRIPYDTTNELAEVSFKYDEEIA